MELLAQIVSKVPGKHKVIVGHCFQRALIHNWDVRAWCDPTNLELIYFRCTRYEVGADSAVVQQSGALNRCTECVYGFSVCFQLTQQNHQGVAVLLRPDGKRV